MNSVLHSIFIRCYTVCTPEYLVISKLFISLPNTETVKERGCGQFIFALYVFFTIPRLQWHESQTITGSHDDSFCEQFLCSAQWNKLMNKWGRKFGQVNRKSHPYKAFRYETSIKKAKRPQGNDLIFPFIAFNNWAEILGSRSFAFFI